MKRHKRHKRHRQQQLSPSWPMVMMDEFRIELSRQLDAKCFLSDSALVLIWDRRLGNTNYYRDAIWLQTKGDVIMIMCPSLGDGTLSEEIPDEDKIHIQLADPRCFEHVAELAKKLMEQIVKLRVGGEKR